MNRDEFLQAVSQLIANSDTAGAGIKASTLGNLILRSLPDHWNQHGYPRLSDLLAELSQMGAVRVGNDAQGALTAWSTGTGLRQRRPERERFQRLRKDVWLAFVSATPPGRRMLHRTTGAVLMGQNDSSPEDGWIRISPISQDEQMSWARELIDSNHLDSLTPILNSPTWYLAFAQGLRDQRSDLLPEWNRLRSSKVSQAVRHWCGENGVDWELVTDKAPTQSPVQPTSGLTALPVKGDVRQVILSALAKMSTEDLLEIPIPAKYLLDASITDRR
jgi:hypothetical protein